jgi:hypothetical protein
LNEDVGTLILDRETNPTAPSRGSTLLYTLQHEQAPHVNFTPPHSWNPSCELG